jgi:hypothetical protein
MYANEFIHFVFTKDCIIQCVLVFGQMNVHMHLADNTYNTHTHTHTHTHTYEYIYAINTPTKSHIWNNNYIQNTMYLKSG